VSADLACGLGSWRAGGYFGLVLLLFTGLVGCGARPLVDEDELIDVTPDLGGNGGTGGSRSTGGSGGGGGTSGGGGTGGGTAGRGGTGGTDPVIEPFRFETRALQKCDLGFTWTAGDSRTCSFRFNGRCYDDEDSVCACACPRDANSVCVLSGFLADPGNPLMVACQKR
jgi:hypothetical protein